ncbi:tail fiber domain-containing protein, partial [Bradyrhizobium sp. GCM10027634]
MKDSPAPPDPYTTADAQTKSNLATAAANQRVNMVNQSNPFGSLNYTQTGTNSDGTPIFSATTTQSEPMASIFSGATGAAKGLLS